MATKECPLCKSEAEYQTDHTHMLVFYACPVCGRFEVGAYNPLNKLDPNHLAAYLLYHKFEHNGLESRYHTVLNKETCDKYREDFDSGNNTHGRPVHMDADTIENWYPKTFSERVDYILLFLNSRIKHIGQRVALSDQELMSALFIDRKELDESSLYGVNKWIDRDSDHCHYEIQYMLDYLVKCYYVEYIYGNGEEDRVYISLTPEGYARVDVLQKNTSYGRQVLVAMKFGDDTNLLREAIRKGIQDAGYTAIFIDEVQHNDFITPELLKHIRDSKFVVVDLTHQNNGAYFEEGYAMGLGKPVIQLCKKDTKLHFDIAQKNTIIWETEDEVPERLANRIRATID